VGGAM